MTYLDKALYILQNTNDGDDLSPEDLSLVQAAVNGQLSDKGEIVFEDLYGRVKGGYKKPWFHGIENLTIDHIGYVHWKGQVVEHYEFPWAYSEEAKAEALELAARCRHLEKINVPINTTNVIWRWEEYAQQSA